MMVDTWEMTNEDLVVAPIAREQLIESLALLLAEMIAVIRPSAVALISALIYSRRMFMVAGKHRTRDFGCSRAILVTALMISHKYYDAFARGTLAGERHSTWLPFLGDDSHDELQLKAMECDFILHIDYRLELTAGHIERFFEAGHMDGGRKMYGMVPRSVDFVASLAETPSCGSDAVVPESSILEFECELL